MYRYNTETRTRTRLRARPHTRRADHRDEWIPHTRRADHRDEWMPHQARELDLKGIEKDLDKLMKDWGDVDLDEMSDKEKKDLEKLDDALKAVQKVIMGVKARKARRVRSRTRQ